VQSFALKQVKIDTAERTGSNLEADCSIFVGATAYVAGVETPGNRGSIVKWLEVSCLGRPDFRPFLISGLPRDDLAPSLEKLQL
jgi:hypothetical protein